MLLSLVTSTACAISHTISWYFSQGSNVYDCLIDATKVFDTVDHYVLLEKLKCKNLPVCVIKFLLSWYRSQQAQVWVKEHPLLNTLRYRKWHRVCILTVHRWFVEGIGWLGCWVLWDNLFVLWHSYADILLSWLPVPRLSGGRCWFARTLVQLTEYLT